MNTADVLYTGRWSDLSRQPFPGVGWYDTARARRLYESMSEFMTVVDAAERLPDDRPRQRWVIGVSPIGTFRCQFFTPAGTLYRLIDYMPRDGRLWRHVTLDYHYPDPDAYFDSLEATDRSHAKFEPDGTGTIWYTRTGEHVGTQADLTDAPVDGFWLDRPAFGHWDDLSDPEYGVPPLPEDLAGP